MVRGGSSQLPTIKDSTAEANKLSGSMRFPRRYFIERVRDFGTDSVDALVGRFLDCIASLLTSTVTAV